MLWPRFASFEKVSEFDFGRCPTRRHVRFVQDGDVTVVAATEKPSVAVLAMVKLALVVRHLGLRLHQPPGFVPPGSGQSKAISGLIDFRPYNRFQAL
jgi:hypothetical protein